MRSCTRRAGSGMRKGASSPPSKITRWCASWWSPHCRGRRGDGLTHGARDGRARRSGLLGEGRRKPHSEIARHSGSTRARPRGVSPRRSSRDSFAIWRTARDDRLASVSASRSPSPCPSCRRGRCCTVAVLMEGRLPPPSPLESRNPIFNAGGMVAKSKNFSDPPVRPDSA